MIQTLNTERRLLQAIHCRQRFIDEEHRSAFRLFNGFYEGLEVTLDVYGETLLINSYYDHDEDSTEIQKVVLDLLAKELPWLRCVFAKYRNSQEQTLRFGKLIFGEKPDSVIREHGVHYALDLSGSQDASFYLDTRFLRRWLIEHSAGLDVLNTFAHTGSLGVAALFGKANYVLQVDRNPRFMDLARQSAMLNHLDLGKMKLWAVDYFVGVGQLKRSGKLFDLAVIDPPFFSISRNGIINQLTESNRLINKIRPLMNDHGRIIAINNALFLKGVDYLQSLEELGKGGFVEIEEIIPIPEDITGFPETIVDTPPVDPAPFNHPTKIVVLTIKRKS